MTNQDLQTVKTDAITLFKANIARQEREFRAALPAHIPVERFVRVLTTAVVNNPALLEADRRSLFLSALRAAQDGLLPDGREGALVAFGNKIQWMPMISGILKKVRNSGELLSIAAHVAYSNDDFTYELGDDEKIHHRPALDDRGKPRLVYAIAKTKDGGIYREIMTVGDVEKVRAVSRAANNGPWVSFWGEMARKTVLRRLSKRLPMSSDLDDLIRRDDYDFDGERADAGSSTHLASRALAETTTDRLTADLDAIAAGGNGGDPPHDPETGEIKVGCAEFTALIDTNARHDLAAKDAQEAERLRQEEMAVLAMRDKVHASDPGARHLAEIYAPTKPQSPPVDTGMLKEIHVDDPKLQALLDAGRAAATNGVAKFRKWENNIPVPSFALIKPHLDALRNAAAAADGKLIGQ